METWRQNHVQIATNYVFMVENQHDTIHDTIHEDTVIRILQKTLHETTASARRRSASSKAKAKAAKPVAWYLKA